MHPTIYTVVARIHLASISSQEVALFGGSVVLLEEAGGHKTLIQTLKFESTPLIWATPTIGSVSL